MDSSRKRVLFLAAFVVLCLSFGLYAYFRGWIHPELIQQTVAETGLWGMGVAILMIVGLEMLWMPRSWGIFAAGALFGPIFGVIVALISDTLSATILYLIGRAGGKKWAESIFSKRPRAKKVAEILVQKRSIPAVAILRIFPFAHYTLVSYLAGMSGVRFSHYIIGNSIGILPFAVFIPILGHSSLDWTSPTFFICLGILAAFSVASAFIGKNYLRNDE